MLGRLLSLFAVAALLSSFAQAYDSTSERSISQQDRDFFEKEVRPLLVKRCFECHGGTKAGGGLSLASAKGWEKGGESGPAIVPGKPDESLLIEAINYGKLEMPPVDKGGQLPKEEIAVLTKWVQIGAPDPRDGNETIGGMSRESAQTWWAFQPLPEGAFQSSRNSDADIKQVDAFLQREIDRNGLTAAPPADRRTLLRRISYDLTGLPPTAEEVESFLADSSPDAWSRVVEGLLASPQYGVQWGRHWLDIVRYADTAGENTDRPLPHAWRYRNWVIDSFHRDLPYDLFVRMQLAGDLLAPSKTGADRTDGIIATGYLAIARRFGHDIEKDMYLTYEDVIDNLGKNFLGLTLGCTRCHDHKYDAVTAEDYYALYGILESTKFAFPGCEPQGQPRDLVPLISQSEIDAIKQPWRDSEARVKQAQQRRDEISQQVFTPESVQATKLLQKTLVKEGGTVDIESRLSVRQGEIILLTVEPGDNHGADSTLADLTIREVNGAKQEWSTRDLVDDLTQANPRTIRNGAWCFVELTKSGPLFLSEKGDAINGNQALKKWSLGDTPSVFVNASDQQVMVWTSLAARSFFVHPGPNRPVCVAWVSPLDGEIVLQGRVADVHPAGLDGVSFRIEHVARPQTGDSLLEAGRLVNEPIPAVEPEPIIPVAYAVMDKQGKNARFQERGDPEKLGAEVPRRWLSLFGGTEVPTESGSGRLELSDWIAHHPLAARVMVNRIWGWHFGRGLVHSSNDFGARGDAPTHPELLDFLATRFVQSGYSVKVIHRIILRSAAYQRASCPPGTLDPENLWLSHFRRRRLTAEELRDSLLATSGSLDLSPGESHPFPAEKTWTFTQHGPFHAVYDTNRRSAYLMVQRQLRHPFLALFDGADPNASTPIRQQTTVPTQALYFINDSFFHNQATMIASELMKRTDQASRIESIWRAVFQRQPTTPEIERSQAFLETYPAEELEKWAALVRVLLASNEFVFLDLQPVE
jgi:mono/diheme cytochrome c family protein